MIDDPEKFFMIIMKAQFPPFVPHDWVKQKSRSPFTFSVHFAVSGEAETPQKKALVDSRITAVWGVRRTINT